jgi:hypothetical protein
MNFAFKSDSVRNAILSAAPPASELKQYLSHYGYDVADHANGDYTLKIFGSDLTVSHRLHCSVGAGPYGKAKIEDYELEVLIFYHDSKEADSQYMLTGSEPNQVADSIMQDFFESDCFVFNPQSIAQDLIN